LQMQHHPSPDDDHWPVEHNNEPGNPSDIIRCYIVLNLKIIKEHTHKILSREVKQQNIPTLRIKLL